MLSTIECADQLQIEANELQARHQREEKREVVVTADQCVPIKRTSCESQAMTFNKKKQVNLFSSITTADTKHEKQSQYHMASISEVMWLTWNNTCAVTLGSRERDADSSLKSSHSVPGTTTHDLHRKQRSFPLIMWSHVLNVFDCVTERVYFGRDWLRCAEAHRSDGRPLSWWSEAPGPSSQRRCPAACSAGNGPWYHMHEVTKGTRGIRRLFKKRIFMPL